MKKNKFQENRIFVLNNPNAPRLSPELAREIGLIQSVLLLQLEFWISIGNNYKEGRKWTYQSSRDIEAFFCGIFSDSTIQRAMKSLRDQELIIVKNYNRMRSDKIPWYALNLEGIKKLKSINVTESLTDSFTDSCFKMNQPDSKCSDLLQNESGMLQFESALLQNEAGFSQDESTLPENTRENTENTQKAELRPERRVYILSEDQITKTKKFYPRPTTTEIVKKILGEKINSSEDYTILNKAIRKYCGSGEVERGAVMKFENFMGVYREWAEVRD